MKTTQLTNLFVNLFVILLCLVILTLMVMAPHSFLDINAVYQGF
jgi:hypothetical protein